PLAPRN
ncbi:nedd8-activating enzyme e1 regulatory subunit, partial [Nannochloropsis oceanica]